MKQTVWKLLSLLLALALCLSLAACRKDSRSGSGKEQGASASASSTQPVCSDSAGETAPSESDGRGEPGATDPAAPGDPAAPTDPNGASAPVGPADPGDPGHSAASTDPAVPGDPDISAPPSSGDGEIVGNWMAPLDLGTVMELYRKEAEAKGEEIPMLPDFTGITLSIELDLRADGTAGFGINEDSAVRAKQALHEPMKQLVLELFAKEGMDEATVEAALKAKGTSLDEMISQAIEENIDLSKISRETQEVGCYLYEDGRLYLADDADSLDDYVVVLLEGDTLTMVSTSNDEELGVIAELFPLVFTRKP